MIAVTNECERYKDIVMAKIVLEFSSAMYKLNEERSHEKIYLSNTIKSHSLWKQLQIWEEIIEISIFDEFRNFETYAAEPNTEDALSRKKNLIFCLLGNFLHLMLSFGMMP
jgi:hypothetical protein